MKVNFTSSQIYIWSLQNILVSIEGNKKRTLYPKIFLYLVCQLYLLQINICNAAHFTIGVLSQGTKTVYVTAPAISPFIAYAEAEEVGDCSISFNVAGQPKCFNNVPPYGIKYIFSPYSLTTSDYDPTKNLGMPNYCPIGNPINHGIGNKIQIETDYLGLSEFNFSREYSSFAPSNTQSSVLGAKWHHLYESKVSQYSGSKTAPVSVRLQAKAIIFKLVAGKWTSDTDVNDKLVELKDLNGVRIGWVYTLDGTGDIYSYDVNGNLLTISDRLGNQKTLAYSNPSTPTNIAPKSGLLIRVTDNLGRSLSFTYDSSSRINTITDLSGGSYTYTYSTDGKGNLTSVTFPDGKIRTYLYGEAAHVSSTPNSGVSYANSLTGIIDENNIRYATYKYDSAGRAFSTEHANEAKLNTMVYNVDGNGNPTSTIVTNPNGSQYTYNFATVVGVVKMTGQSQPAGSGCAASDSAITYDANGNVATRTDFNSNKTTYAYDMARNLETSRTEGLTSSDASTPATRTITTSWHSAWRLPLIISEYSGKMSTGTPLKRTTYLYDDKGNITSYTVEDPLRGLSRTTTTSYVYSTAVPGLVLEKTVDGPLAGSNDITRYFYYPHDANCADSTADPIVDPITGVAPPNLGCRGQLSHVIEKSGFGVVYSRYNHHGQVEEWTDSNQVIYTNSYDLRQRLIRSTVENEQTQYSYDDAGLLKKTTFPDGSELNYTYDPAHRLREISNAMGDKVVYTLDDEGNRTNEEMFDSSGTLTKSITRSFDALNRAYMVTGE